MGVGVGVGRLGGVASGVGVGVADWLSAGCAPTGATISAPAKVTERKRKKEITCRRSASVAALVLWVMKKSRHHSVYLRCHKRRALT